MKLLRLATRGELGDIYYQNLSYRLATAEKLPSLQEFLSLASKKSGNEPIDFDDVTDKKLETEAFKRLAERQKRHG